MFWINHPFLLWLCTGGAISLLILVANAKSAAVRW
jgi:hypothetical protein